MTDAMDTSRNGKIDNSPYKYYAFISYNNRDERWAKRVQRQLHDFRLPSVVRKTIGDDVRIDPVFRYKTNLPPGPLRTMISEELERSKYLLVICSPNSAQPNANGVHWVNDEILRFMEIGRADRIIPVIVGGEPNAGGADECFPPALRQAELGGVNLCKGSRNERRYEFLRLVARILGLSPDTLIDEWKDDRRRLRLVLAGLSFCIAALGGLLGWWIYDRYAEHSACYRDYVNEWGEPKGIFELTGHQVRELLGHYRFVWKGYLPDGRRKLKSVRFCDSYGNEYMRDCTESDWIKTIVDHPLGRDYFWTDDGRLKRIRQYGADGCALYDYVFTSEDVIDIHNACGRSAMANFNTGNMRNANDSLRYDPLGLKDLLPVIPFLAPRSRVSRYFIAERNTNGLPVKISYMVAGTVARKVCNEFGAWGASFEYDALGRTVFIGSTDRDGLLARGNDRHRKIFYETTNIWTFSVNECRQTVTNAEGVAIRRFSYDGSGNFREVVCLDAMRNPMPNRAGLERVVFETDERNGKLRGCRFFGTGRYREKNRLSDFRIVERDAHGRCMRLECRDYEGNYTVEGVGAPVCLYQYGPDWISESFYDGEGRPFVNDSYGCYRRKRFIRNGVFEGIAVYDQIGRSMNAKNGLSKIWMQYDGFGLLQKVEIWRAVDFKLVLAHCFDVSYEMVCGNAMACSVKEIGKASGEADVYRKDEYGRIYEHERLRGGVRINCTRVEFDEMDRIVGVSVLGEGDRPICTNRYGAVAQRVENVGERHARFFCVNAKGEKTLGDDGSRIVLRRYDNLGNVDQESLYDWDGQTPMLWPGFSVHRREMDYDLARRVVEERLLDVDLNPTTNAYGCCRWTTAYSKMDNSRTVTGFGLQEEVVCRREIDALGKCRHFSSRGVTGMTTPVWVVGRDSVRYPQLKAGDYAWLVNGFPVSGGSDYERLLFENGRTGGSEVVFARRTALPRQYVFFTVAMDDMTDSDPYVERLCLFETEYLLIQLQSVQYLGKDSRTEAEKGCVDGR